MPLQNRVTPFGELIAVSDYGTFMGNRGCLHDEQRRIVREFSGSKLWIICRIDFKGRKRTLMSPNSYTELFFLDEATALAAGHRPCGECRRECFRQFKATWLKGNPQSGLNADSPIRLVDSHLHRDRLTDHKEKRIHSATLGDLPDGAFVRLPTSGNAFLLSKSRLLRWTPSGYDEMCAAERCQVVEVLTPRTVINAMHAGYEPTLHSTAIGQVSLSDRRPHAE